MTSFHANAPGDDSRNVNGEYIRVTNTTSIFTQSQELLHPKYQGQYLDFSRYGAPCREHGKSTQWSRIPPTKPRKAT